MINVLFGFAEDDYRMNKGTFIIEKNNSHVSKIKYPASLWNNKKLFGKYIRKKVHPFITDEKEIIFRYVF